jgi:hypothetical protein
MRTPHDPRPTRPRARRALPPGWLVAAAWALAPLLLASCTDDLATKCPPLANPPALTVAAAASNPCAARKGETAKQLELRIVQRYQRTQPPNPAGPTYPLRCGTKSYGYLHLLDEIGQGHHDHCDPANDDACRQMIAFALQHGLAVAQQGGNYRYTVRYNDAQSMCHKSDWGFRLVIGPNLPIGVLVHLDGLPVGIVTAFRLPSAPSSYP